MHGTWHLMLPRGALAKKVDHYLCRTMVKLLWRLPVLPRFGQLHGRSAMRHAGHLRRNEIVSRRQLPK